MVTAIAVVAAALAIAFAALYLRHRGKRLVTCPETNEPVAVDAELAFLRKPRFVISACSRWPARAGCDQACAPQVDADPDETRVKSIVARWYAERTCVYCGKPIGELGGAVQPALRTADGKLLEWTDVAAENLPELFASAAAVCPRCELAEDFRRRFARLVVDRPETPLRNRAVY